LGVAQQGATNGYCSLAHVSENLTGERTYQNRLKEDEAFMIERDGETVRIYSAKWKAWLGVVVMASVSGIGVALYQSGNDNLSVWAMLVFGPLSAVSMLFFALYRKPLIEMDGKGVRFFGGMFKPPLDVPWSDIEDIRILESRFNKLIGFQFKSDAPAAQGALARFNFAALGTHGAVQCATLPGENTQMFDLIVAKWELGRVERNL